MFYDEYKDWNSVIKMLDTVYQEEIEVVKDKSVVQKWHQILQKYFAQKPNVEIWTKPMEIDGISHTIQTQIIDHYRKIEHDENIDLVLKKMKEKI